MRSAFLLPLLLVAVATQAQDLQVVDPTVSVDGRRAAVVGAPLAQRPFRMLTIDAPGVGTFSVRDEPFAGARPAGQFDGTGLYFAGGGRTVRLRSTQPILGGGQRLAYVRFEPSGMSPARGPVRLSAAGSGALVGAPGATSVPIRTDRTPYTRTALRTAATAQPTAETSRLQTETARLRADLDRLMRERQQLTEERARLAASLQARVPEVSRGERGRRLGRETQNANELARRLTQQRDQLAAERDQLLAERNALISQRAAAEAARRGDAAALDALQARLARIDARNGPSPSTSELWTLRAQAETLRAQLAERDQTIQALRAERDSRTGRAAGVSASLAEIQAELSDTRRALASARAERDAALEASSASDAARLGLEAELASTNAARVALDRELRQLRGDRGRLSAVPRGSAPSARLGSSETGRAELAELDARTADLDRRQALVEEQEAMQGDRVRLTQELATARDEIETLRTDPTGLRTEGASLAGPAAPPAETERSSGAAASLPGFDFSRLENPDQVRRRLGEITYPRWAETGRIEGDVLVLFQSDRDGAVVRTAVPTPLGGGLDALAEDLVRQMRFVPPTVSGQAAGLRSQVTVRFEL